MSTDPRNELMTETGPLGTKSGVPKDVAEQATPVQAALLVQNDEQLNAIAEMRGELRAGFSGAHARIDWLETKFGDRLQVLETFNDRVTLLPKAVAWLAGVIGLDGIIHLLHWL